MSLHGFKDHKKIWVKTGDNFLVEVHRWQTGLMCQEGHYKWNVYCYIYPKHKLFKVLKKETIIVDIFNNLITTYCRWHRDADGTITAKQYGSDYGHIWDNERINRTRDPERVYQVFNDAEALFQELNE